MKREQCAAMQGLGIPMSEFTENLLSYFEAEWNESIETDPIQKKCESNHEIGYYGKKLLERGVELRSSKGYFVAECGLANKELYFGPEIGQQNFIKKVTKLLANSVVIFRKLRKKEELISAMSKIENDYKEELRYTFYKEIGTITLDNIETMANIISICTYFASSEEEAIQMFEVIVTRDCPEKHNLKYLEVFSDMPMGFWAHFARSGVFPKIFKDNTLNIDPQFIKALTEIKSESNEYHGGCPARHKVYYDKNHQKHEFKKSAVVQFAEFFLNRIKVTPQGVEPCLRE